MLKSLPKLSTDLVVRSVENEEELLVARQLHATSYLENDYIGPEDISNEGTIDDHWVDVSDYIVVVDNSTGEIIGTARLVQASVHGFPASAHGPWFPEASKIFSEVDPKLCAEISALATVRRNENNSMVAYLLYKRLAEMSIFGGKSYVFGVFDHRLLKVMRGVFNFTFDQIGPKMPERSHSTVPTVMYVPDTISAWVTLQPQFVDDLTGLTAEQITEIAEEMRQRTPHRVLVDVK